ncbi:MAG: reverse transcriptase domain-containing protein [Rudaea sp.]|nr:reverse transcriptase domain-containing protein [Rudaea sp.]
MTTPRYADTGCAAGSQVRGCASSSPDASSPADYAWNVNFNNGNSDYNHRNNNAFVRAVRSVSPASAGEYQGVTFRALFDAWQCARRKKVPSRNQLGFEANWIDGLLDLVDRIGAGTWRPKPTTCFIAKRPKAREIHAPDFGDRVVHHWLVPQLEAIYEPRFIADSFANRKGKGTHGAVDRLRGFVRQVQSGQSGGWYLQLDIHNFFNSIHRPTLYAMLKRSMVRAGTPLETQRIAHALLATSPLQGGAVTCSTPAERALVPLHKRMENAAPGCGLPIGNLSSQFFANVYLDALDQFAKHTLKAKRYVRYVDDFVLVHRDRAQLQTWLMQIEQFLRDKLRLALKPDIRIRPLRAGIDFLGYVIYPTHTRVRRRVVKHACAALAAWSAGHVRGAVIRATPAALRGLRSIWRSYQGHMAHANSVRLRASIERRFPWLACAVRSRKFAWQLDVRVITLRVAA